VFKYKSLTKWSSSIFACAMIMMLSVCAWVTMPTNTALAYEYQHDLKFQVVECIEKGTNKLRWTDRGTYTAAEKKEKLNARVYALTNPIPTQEGVKDKLIEMTNNHPWLKGRPQIGKDIWVKTIYNCVAWYVG